MLISIVIPCYRSEKTLPGVVEEIRNAFAGRPDHDYQIVLVNDGSPDQGATYRTIQKLCQEDSKIVGVDMSRNFGQARAKMAALGYVKGDCVVYMDDDGQHPAEGIFKLVDKLQEGYDVVYARFPQKKHSLFKRVTSNMFRRVQEMLKVKAPGIYISSFYAISRFAVEALKRYHSPAPSSGAYLLNVTTKFANIDIEHRSRAAGTSNYSLKKLFALALTSMTNFTMIPLRASAVLGAVIACLGFLYGLVLVIQKTIYPSVAIGYTSQMAILLLLGGMILLVLGIVGEYIGRIYMILSDLPQYVIREAMNAGETIPELEKIQ